MEKIIVTGATGFLGKHVMKVLEDYRDSYEIIGISSKDYDLRKEEDTKKMFEELKPNYIIHLAAKVGGILANKEYPADFFYDNILILTYMFKYSAEYRIKRLLIPIGGCSYPSNAPSPIKEDYIWNGLPQIESAPYSVAKRTALIQLYAYKKQYGLNCVVIIPGNMYGEFDNFSLKESHVIPALIRKFYEAKLYQKKVVELWGTGRPIRDFVYVGDVAKLIPYFLLKYDGDSPINISRGEGITIKELAEKIAKYIGYDGKIYWNTQYPDGQMIKVFSVEKLHSLNLRCETSLDEGLVKTINWFINNYEKVVRKYEDKV